MSSEIPLISHQRLSIVCLVPKFSRLAFSTPATLCPCFRFLHFGAVISRFQQPRCVYIPLNSNTKLLTSYFTRTLCMRQWKISGNF